MSEKIKIVYIDNDPEEAISEYLADKYHNEKYDIEYKEERFNSKEGYESLLESSSVTEANVIIVDSRLFEDDTVRVQGKFSGEEFRIILRKIYPFIEVLVITQNEENSDYGIIQKYRSESAETAEQYYNRILKEKMDESIDRVITFRNISKKLKENKGIEKYLTEKITNSLNGINDYDELSKNDIDRFIEAFKELK